MGSGRWSTNVYSAAASYRAASGRSAFDYSDRVMRGTPRSDWKAHPDLDPRGVAMRESRDSAEHPESLAIAVLFDVTGSMGSVPRTLQAKLPDLFGLLLRKGYVEHPQIMFGAIGDATCDRVPLQVGQFESDNRMDEHLGNILIEGGGGGQKTESYELAMWFMAHHTSTDCWEKRGHKGYLFIIGDEMAYPKATKREIRDVLGQEVAASVPTEKVIAELRARWEVFYILPEGSAYAGDDQVFDYWRGLLGQNAIRLDDLNAACETIALTIGLAEGTVDLDEGLDHLSEVGSTAGTSVSKALAPLAANAGTIAVSSLPDSGPSDPGGVIRL